MSTSTVAVTNEQQIRTDEEQKTIEPIGVHGTSTDNFMVFLEDSEKPQNLTTLRKWIIVVLISSAALCVTCASSMASFTEEGAAREFHISKEISILSISLYIEGLGLGPLVFGPLSEVYGRNLVYRGSYILFFAFNFAVAFSPDVVVYLIFRFITGFCGSAFMSVAGGSVSDLFTDGTVANPMAFYTISPFIGPVVGPLLSGFINQNLNWRWTYYVLLIWIFSELVGILVLIPETHVPTITKWKAQRLRREKDERYWAPLDLREGSLAQSILKSCYTPFRLVIFDRMALLLDLWTSMILGILYLTFQAFPVIFTEQRGFSTQLTGLTFCGIGLGMLIGLSTQPYWNRMYSRVSEANDGVIPPEARLLMGEVGGVLTPLGLYWLAFTTYRSVHWIVPIVASIPFGTGTYFVFTSTFSYLVTAYRPIAASAMASNSALRSTFAAIFPLFAGAMYKRLGTVGATALLAGIMTLMTPLPFIFRRIGARLRAESRFAV